jgi:hypothetical protein
VKNHDFRAKNHIFFNFRGGGRGTPGAPPLYPPPETGRQPVSSLTVFKSISPFCFSLYLFFITNIQYWPAVLALSVGCNRFPCCITVLISSRRARYLTYECIPRMPNIEPGIGLFECLVDVWRMRMPFALHLTRANCNSLVNGWAFVVRYKEILSDPFHNVYVFTCGNLDFLVIYQSNCHLSIYKCIVYKLVLVVHIWLIDWLIGA